MSNLLVRLSTAFGLSLAVAGCATTSGPNVAGGSLSTPSVSTSKGTFGASSSTRSDCVIDSQLNLGIFKIGNSTFSDRCAAYKAATEMVASGDPSLMVLGTAALAELEPMMKRQVRNYAEGKGGEMPKTSEKACRVVDTSQPQNRDGTPRQPKPGEQVSFRMVCS